MDESDTSPRPLERGPSARRWAANYQVMVKPAGPACNYHCAYCYYSGKQALFARSSRRRIADDLVERFVRDCIAAQDGPEVNFCWQGGEPTLLGRGFFERVLDLQAKHCLPGKRILNALQTHGGLLDKSWAVFLRENNFLVGLSIDGPRDIHNAGRRDRRGRPTFDKTRRAVMLLREHGVAFNTLTVVHARNADRGPVIYKFLRRLGVRHMQFIPLVERLDGAGNLAAPPRLAESANHKALSPWSVPPDGYGRFLCAVFDEWRKADIGRVFVQMFDLLLGLRLGHPSSLCVFAETCGRGPVLEHNGDLFSCDHYVYPQFRLGNIAQVPLDVLVNAPRQQAFGLAKRKDLPTDCEACRFLLFCFGGCPKHRFTPAADGTPRLNYLCPSYRTLFTHTEPVMSDMAALLRAGQPAKLAARARGTD
jgi:uncharacterized protein